MEPSPIPLMPSTGDPEEAGSRVGAALPEGTSTGGDEGGIAGGAVRTTGDGCVRLLGISPKEGGTIGANEAVGSERSVDDIVGSHGDEGDGSL